MKEICETVYLLESTKGSYAYLVDGPEPVLVDTSLPGRARAMQGELSRDHLEPKHIVITHYDVDHIGNMLPLAQHYAATLWLPQDDVPYILGERPRPGLKRLIGSLMRVAAPTSYQALAYGAHVQDLEAIASPGHTPGHMAFKGNGYLLVGDALRTKEGRVVPSPGLLSWNREIESRSRHDLIERFSGWILPAHGEPLRWGDV